MTLKEADEAAMKLLPVIYDGIEYARISRTGYYYDETGKRHGFLELCDKCRNSVIQARPENVTLKD